MALPLWPKHHLLATPDGYLAHLQSYVWHDPEIIDADLAVVAAAAGEPPRVLANP